ncbi:hypothetical protein [Pantoea agglomerans]|uniref:hypothetical protein n=1 Tax=Enterobacter agglomerans TaxID=549 RepID=UPI003C7E16B5
MESDLHKSNKAHKKVGLKKYAKWLNIFGGLISVASIFFVVLRLKVYLNEDVLVFFNLTNLLIVSLIAFSYGITSIILGCSWRYLLAMSGSVHTFRWAIGVYGIAQLAKYMPGNIFHFAGRQVLGMADGVSAKSLLKSTFWELVILVISGGVFIIIVIPSYLDSYLQFKTLAMCAFVFSVFFIGIFSYKFINRFFTIAFFLQLSFLVFSGFVFYLILLLVSTKKHFFYTEDYWMLMFVPAAFVTAWLIGLVTPGAPAGIGIREVVLIYLLGSYFDNSEIILAVVVSRIVTVSGDVFFYFIANAFRRVSINAC